jgi:hypothetical protein
MRRSTLILSVTALILSCGAQWARAGTYFNVNSVSNVYAQFTINGTATGGMTDVSSGAGTKSISAANVAASTTLSSSSSTLGSLYLQINKSDTRDGIENDYSQSQWAILFTPNQNLAYSISGDYLSLVADTNSRFTDNIFLTQGATQLYAGQISNTVTNGLNLTTNVPITAGSLTGVLQAGVQYDYNGTSAISAYATIGGDVDTGTGLDVITFTPVPEPASIVVLGVGAISLLNRRRRSM